MNTYDHKSKYDTQGNKLLILHAQSKYLEKLYLIIRNKMLLSPHSNTPGKNSKIYNQLFSETLIVVN